MAEPNFRALAQELNTVLVWVTSSHPDLHPTVRRAVIYCSDRARQELATPPPEPPTDEKLDDLWDEVAGYYNLYEEAREFGRRAWELGQ